MKIYIMQDGEGVSGIVDWEMEMTPEKALEARHLMTLEVNAAVEGAFGGGAKEVFVQESHKFIIEELHEEIKLVQGARKHAIDESFDAVFIVGQHAMARSENAVLCHTFCHSGVRKMLLNGEPIGETGWTAAYAGCFNVPVALLTGDKAATDEAVKLLGNIEVAIVKEGLGLHSAISLSPVKARKLIREKATAAMKRIKEFKPFKVSAPMELVIEYFNPAVAEKALLYPGVKRLDATKISFVTDSFLKAFDFRSFSALIHGR